ncbi:MAG: acetate--CoA ligase family protein, partial [Pseudooceanicola atlanticus]
SFPPPTVVPEQTCCSHTPGAVAVDTIGGTGAVHGTGVSRYSARSGGGGDEWPAEAAQEFNRALVMKVDSPDILHKSDIGGVELNIHGPEEARAAYDRIMIACHKAHPDAQIDGILVQEMVPQGLELIAGFRNAEGFGPVLTVGLGGVLTEVLADTATALAPVDTATARSMLQSLRGARLLDGYRGAPPVDMDRVAQAIAALSRLAVDFPDRIAEFDVNPLICLPDRCVAVDGLAVLRQT